MNRGTRGIFQAAHVNNLKQIKTLAQQNVNVDLHEGEDASLLYYAILQRKIPLVGLLLRCGANIQQHHKSHNTPLQLAIMTGNELIVRRFLAIGACLESEDKEEERGRCKSVFVHAVEIRNEAVVCMLLDAGVDTMGPLDNGQSLVHAAGWARESIVERILDRGCNVHQTIRDNVSAIQMVAVRNDSESVKVASLLLQHGADTNIFTNSGRSPLYSAVNVRNYGLCECLINAGANVNFVNPSPSLLGGSKSVLSLACEIGALDLANLLISRGASVNGSPKERYPPLHYAVKNGHSRLVQLLVEWGADFDGLDARSGCTPISAACTGGEADVVKYLLKVGVVVHVDEIIGKTEMVGRGNKFGKRRNEHRSLLKRHITSILELAIGVPLP